MSEMSDKSDKTEMVKTWRLNNTDGPGGLIVDDPMDLSSELEACEPEDGPMYIFIEERTREEIDNLPEFDGF